MAFHNFFLLLPLPSGEVWLKFWVYSLISWLCVYCAICRGIMQAFF
uniref:Uncharacterized protein n=1 Tax=Phage sp. ctHEp8 TaxID=2825790 RepID=A0A8S5TY65_9VIRU|nr:MAG TPA: hypothetical protein [Phage sp. ctHEp8]